MSETKKLISALDVKVGLLLEKMKKTSAALQTKTAEAESLKKQMLQLEEQVASLRSENQELRSMPATTAVAEPVAENSEETKARISELVKEIDTCISMLKV
jgi:regulator of replication initiation timing